MKRRKNSKNTLASTDPASEQRSKRGRKSRLASTANPHPTEPQPDPSPLEAQHAVDPSPSRHPSRNPPPTPKGPKFCFNSIRTEVPREFPSSKQANRLFGLQHCPVFYPTIDEFKEPMKYFESISSKLKPYGIGKIVPPVGWKPPFVLDTQQFKFKTRLQRLNSMEASARANLNFLEQLYLFHKQRGSSGFINSSSKIQVPIIDHRPVDLWRLRKEINQLGGYDNITLQRKWSFLAKSMGYNVKASPAISFKLKAAYTKIIAPFDEYFNRVKQSPPKPANNISSGERSPADSLSPLTSSLADHDEINRVPILKEANQDECSMADTPARSASKLLNSSLADASQKRLASSILQSRRPSTSRPSISYDFDTSVDHGGDVCEICGSDEDDSNILLCDSCDKGFHLQCLTPPLLTVPEGNWYCDTCIVSTGNEFGFEEGKEHTLSSFQRRADSFKKMWLDNHPTSQRSSRRQSLAKDEEPEGVQNLEEGTSSGWSSKPFKDQLILEDFLEKEFWRLVECQTETVEIEYGADINSAAYGSGFPNIEKHPFDPYSRDGWNLNNLPIAPGSLLRFIKSDVAGMTQPWIYVGMVFSTFAWHKEDHYTYSINYHHWGDTKTWYGVPGEDDTKLEEAMKAAAPELFEQQPDLMFQLVTLMSPGRLQRAGVRTYVCDQRPNEFVITCPRSYHSGFNHGFNLNEAVNFCLPDWLPEGYLCVKHYKALQKMPVFSHDELLITIFLNEKSPRVSRWLLPHFREMVERELADRQLARTQITNLSADVTIEPVDLPEDQVQCHHCKAFAFLSQVTSPQSSKVSCFDHSDILGDGPKVLRYKYTDEELQGMLMRVNSRSIKAGRLVDMSGIEQRTSGRKRKPSAALLEATRAALPLAQKMKLAHASSTHARETHPGNSESAMANESSLECDEDDKMENGSTTSDLYAKQTSVTDEEKDLSADHKPPPSHDHSRLPPTFVKLGPAPVLPSHEPHARSSENHKPNRLAKHDSPVEHRNRVGPPIPPNSSTEFATPHSTLQNVASAPASPSRQVGNPSTVKRRGRPAKTAEMRAAEVAGKRCSPQSSHRETLTTPSSSSASHVHRLPLVAQIDVGGSASIVQLSPSREPLMCARTYELSTSHPRPESRREKSKKAINLGDQVSIAPSARQQTLNPGGLGTNLIKLKSSGRAVSQPLGPSHLCDQIDHLDPNFISKRELEKLSPIVLQPLPRLTFPEPNQYLSNLPGEPLSKPSPQTLSTVSNPRGPTASSLMNILNPITTEPGSPFDRHSSPSLRHQSTESTHSAHHLYHSPAFSNTSYSSQLQPTAQSSTRLHSLSNPTFNSNLPASQPFGGTYRPGPISPAGLQQHGGSDPPKLTLVSHVPRSPSAPHHSSPNLRHAAASFKSHDSTYPLNPRASPQPLYHPAHRRVSSTSYATNSFNQDPVRQPTTDSPSLRQTQLQASHWKSDQVEQPNSPLSWWSDQDSSLSHSAD